MPGIGERRKSIQKQSEFNWYAAALPQKKNLVN